MWKYICICICILLISCKHNQVEQPKKLLPPSVFEEILYDISVLNSIKNNHYSTWEKYTISPQTIVYQKYNIDSLDWAQNFVYYVNQPQVYKDIVNHVDTRLKSERDSLKNNKDSVELLIKNSLQKQYH